MLDEQLEESTVDVVWSTLISCNSLPLNLLFVVSESTVLLLVIEDWRDSRSHSWLFKSDELSSNSMGNTPSLPLLQPPYERYYFLSSAKLRLIIELYCEFELNLLLAVSLLLPCGKWPVSIEFILLLPSSLLRSLEEIYTLANAISGSYLSLTCIFYSSTTMPFDQPKTFSLHNRA